jgi:PIN domain nuclease of toxin-antitoxin system
LVVLDSWALLAYLKGEPASDRIEVAWLAEGAAISSINLGEVLYNRAHGEGKDPAAATVAMVRKRLDVIDPDWPMVEAAARIKADGGLSYADAFCIATAVKLEAPLWTGDPEIIGQADRHSCRVVDLRGDTY